MEKMNTIAVREINTLFDSGTFVEIGSYVRRNDASNELEGVVCGYGSIGGKLVFAFAQDGEKMKGAFDDKHAKKIENLYKMAENSDYLFADMAAPETGTHKTHTSFDEFVELTKKYPNVTMFPVHTCDSNQERAQKEGLNVLEDGQVLNID